jgi:hypothetical protein
LVGSDIRTIRLLKSLLDTLSKYDTQDLQDARLWVSELAMDAGQGSHFRFSGKRADRGKVEVIGKLPFVLLDEKYFPDIESLNTFARTLGIVIPSGHKSRNEIIGIIIADVAVMNQERLGRLRVALDKILGRARKGPISNFIREWEDVIKGTDFQR